MRKIVIVDYDHRWPAMFEAEREQIQRVIGDYIEAIEHVGSTAVPGLGAKPIIDIMVGVHALAVADVHCIKPIIALGYEYVPQYEDELPFRRYFRKLTNEGTHTHHIHLVESGSDFWVRHLLFRDYLSAHPGAAAAYEQLKRELAVHLLSTDYTEAKTDFILATEARAQLWRKNHR